MTIRFVAMTAALALFPSLSSAAPILPGQTFPAPPNDHPVGGTVYATTSLPFITVAFSGSFSSTVIVGDPENTFGGLTFIYQLTNDATSTEGFNLLDLSGFRLHATDVSYRQQFGLTAPTTVSRDLTGDAISFLFTPAPGGGVVGPGSSSAMLVLQTDAHDYQTRLGHLGLALLLGAGPADSYTDWPEPGSAAGIVSVAQLASVRRRRGRTHLCSCRAM